MARNNKDFIIAEALVLEKSDDLNIQTKFFP